MGDVHTYCLPGCSRAHDVDNAQGEAMQVMAAGEDGVAIVGDDEVVDSSVLRNLRIALPDAEDRLDVNAKLLAARSCNEEVSESTLGICCGMWSSRDMHGHSGALAVLCKHASEAWEFTPQ